MRPLSARRSRRSALVVEALDRLVLLSSDLTAPPSEPGVEVAPPAEPTDEVLEDEGSSAGEESGEETPVVEMPSDVPPETSETTVVDDEPVATEPVVEDLAADNSTPPANDPPIPVTTEEAPIEAQTTAVPEAVPVAVPEPVAATPPPRVEVAPSPENLRVDLSVERTSEFAGRTVRFHMREMNVGRDAIRLGPLHDFDVVVMQAGNEVWRLSDVRGQRGINPTLSFEPGASRGVSVWWDGFRSRGGRAPVSGPVDVYAVMDGISSSRQTFQIRPTPASQARPTPQPTRVEIEPVVTPTPAATPSLTPTPTPAATPTPATPTPPPAPVPNPTPSSPADSAPVVTLARTSTNRPNNRSFAFRRQVELSRRIRKPVTPQRPVARPKAAWAALRQARLALSQANRRPS